VEQEEGLEIRGGADSRLLLDRATEFMSIW
jgi:hypothetical protein